MDDIDERRKCVVDFLSFLELSGTAVTNSLGLPAFNAISASWTYGLKIDNLVFKFRNAEPRSFVESLASMTVEEFIHFAIAPESFNTYVQWSKRIRNMVVQGKVSGTVTSESFMAAMSGARKCLVQTSKNKEKLARTLVEFEAPNSKVKILLNRDITKASTLKDVLNTLVKLFGIKDGVDYFSKVIDPEPIQSLKKSKPKPTPVDVASLNTFISGIRKKIAKAVAKKNINEHAQLVASVAVTTDKVSAMPFLEASRFVVVLDDMTLHSSSAKVLDASEVLSKLAVLLNIVVKKLASDKRARQAVLDTIDSVIDALQGSKSLGNAKEQKEQIISNTKVLQRLEASAFPKMGLVKSKSLFFRGGIDTNPPPPPPPAPYPYPPGQPAPNGPYPSETTTRQEVYVHEDPYMKTVAGLSVGAQCCSCCAMWELADSIGDI